MTCVLALVIAGCGGGGASGTSGSTVAQAHPVAKHCDVEEVEGEIYYTESDLRGLVRGLNSALAGKKTVLEEPGGPAPIRGYSARRLEAIHRELREARKLIRSC